MFSPAPLKELQPVSRGLIISPKPRSAASIRSGSSRSSNTLKSDSTSSVQSMADENLSMVDIEDMLSEKVRRKKEDLKAAFQAFDQECNSTVTAGEFRRVIEGFLVPLTQYQFEALLSKVPKRKNGSIPYMEFLKKYCKISPARIRIPQIRGGQQNWTLGELQCHLKDKIGSNLKNVVRAFRLFDFNQDGQIQQHELLRVLEGYCFPLTQQEFHRLWSHYNPNNTETVSYREFLEKLGVDCENCRKIAPDSAKLALNWVAVNQMKRRQCSKTLAWIDPDKPDDTLDEIQIRFLKKMNLNYGFIQRAFQAFDTTGCGFVSQEDLRSVLSNFIFPMDDYIFHGLLKRFGVTITEPVEWSHFLSLFRDEQCLPVRDDIPPATSDLSDIEAVVPKLQDHISEVYPQLKRAFQVLDESRSGMISQAELRRLLEGLVFSLTDQQFTGLTALLVPDTTGAVHYQRFLELFHPQGNIEGLRGTSSAQGTPTQPAEESPAAPAWSTVEELLKEKLSGDSEAVMEFLSNQDPCQTGAVSVEEMRKLIHQFGLPLSVNHFNKLCNPFWGAKGVNYRKLLRSLGIPKDSGGKKSPNKAPSLTERPQRRGHLDSVKNQAVVDVVLRRLRSSLQQRGLSLQDCLTAASTGSGETLGFRGFCKILEDSNIILDKRHLKPLLEALEFCDGQISFSKFVAKYEEATVKQRKTDLQRNPKTTMGNTVGLMVAEDCLSQMKRRIEKYHGNIFAAFRLMDKNHDGVVNRSDFRNLFDTLMFVIKEREYQRLLDLLGLTPGATLNYAEFLNCVQSADRTTAQLNINSTSDQWLDLACEQVHNHLTDKARHRWLELSKALCQFGEDGKRIITKNNLRHVLYRYCLPVTPTEFEHLWARYDESGRGYLTQSEFLDKLNVVPEEEVSRVSHVTAESQSDPQLQEQVHGRIPVTTRSRPALQDLMTWIRTNFEAVSGALVELDKERNGCVTLSDLLRLFHTLSFPIDETALLQLLNNLGTDTQDRKLLYLDFLERLVRRGVSGSVIASPVHRTISGSPGPGESLEELSPDRALQRVRQLVTSNSDSLYRAFSAFDKTRSSLIPQLEFRRVLDHFCTRLTDEQFRRLLMKLRLEYGEDSLVDWTEFLQVFSLNKQETLDEWIQKIRKAHFPNQAHPLPIHDVLSRIQEVVSTRLYTITNEMADTDYAHINTISREDFKTICDKHFVRLNSQQFETLWKILPVNVFGNLEYREFLKKFSGEIKELDMSGGSPLSGPASPTESKAAVLQRPKTVPCLLGRAKRRLTTVGRRPCSAGGRATSLLNCEVMEKRLCSQIRGCWRVIQKKCREVDTDRSGEIDVQNFLDILNGLHVEMSQLDFEQLALKYDIHNSGRFSYPEFLRHFVLTLSPQVMTSSNRLRLQVTRAPLSAGPLSDQCVEAMLRLYGCVQMFWRSIRQDFGSFDRERSGTISLKDFRIVLRQYSVNLTEEEFFHLTSYFDKNISGRIPYNDFLRIFLN
ncbi:EF-hand calcium-binding domain-containing protein 6 [Chanos chanos]|uniref:EF-hand calcium-binding domain-containing protein 6 n=1 Tax=Chanos chanos TaxID=29144 RepID=A0A6J2ULF9_CHACN|nr:EF-hand calcium-binding domain-containing protein 6 [Chanos chanos]